MKNILSTITILLFTAFSAYAQSPVTVGGCTATDPCSGVICNENQTCINGDCVCTDPNACNADEVGECIYADVNNCLDCDGNTVCADNETCDGNGNCVSNCTDCVENIPQEEISITCDLTDLGNGVNDLEITATSPYCDGVSISASYDGESFTTNPFTIQSNANIDIVVIFDNSGSANSANYIETQQQALLDFINNINNGVLFSDCGSVNLSIIPHGIGNGGHCNTALSSDPCSSDPLESCLCYVPLLPVSENSADMISFVQGLTTTYDEPCGGCGATNNDDIGAIQLGASILSGASNPYMVYMTDYVPAPAPGSGDCNDGFPANSSCCDNVLSELTALQGVVELIGVGLGDSTNPNFACGAYYPTNAEWLNEAINGNGSDDTNVVQVPNPDTNFDLTEVISILEGQNLTMTVTVCGQSFDYTVFVDNCSTTCPSF